MKKRWIAIVACVLVFGFMFNAIALGFLRPTKALADCEFGFERAIDHSGMNYTMIEPRVASVDEITSEFIRYSCVGGIFDVPRGFALKNILPTIKVSQLPGVETDSTGNVLRRKFQLTIRSYLPSDMDSACLYINGRVKFTATRDNGSIVDLQGGNALATVVFWEVSCGSASAAIEVIAVDGTVERSEYSFSCSGKKRSLNLLEG